MADIQDNTVLIEKPKKPLTSQEESPQKEEKSLSLSKEEIDWVTREIRF